MYSTALVVAPFWPFLYLYVRGTRANKCSSTSVCAQGEQRVRERRHGRHGPSVIYIRRSTRQERPRLSRRRDHSPGNRRPGTASSPCEPSRHTRSESRRPRLSPSALQTDQHGYQNVVVQAPLLTLALERVKIIIIYYSCSRNYGKCSADAGTLELYIRLALAPFLSTSERFLGLHCVGVNRTGQVERVTGQPD